MQKIKTSPLSILAFTRTKTLRALEEFFEFIGGSMNLLYATALSVLKPPYYPKLFAEQCYALGVKSFSIAFITAVSTGMVMSIQFGFGLERFGGKLYVPKVVGLSIMRELGPVLTCLMIAGRVGSGIAAEIGSMKVTQQIDAIRALGTDPIKKIVIPRILALLLMTPLLTIMADLVGIGGGLILSYFELNIHYDYYINEGLLTLRLSDFTVGVAKSVFFGLIIGLTGCYYGLRADGGTQGVGQATRQSVVTSSILITIFDFILTKVFWLFERGFDV